MTSPGPHEGSEPTAFDQRWYESVTFERTFSQDPHRIANLLKQLVGLGAFVLDDRTCPTTRGDEIISRNQRLVVARHVDGVIAGTDLVLHAWRSESPLVDPVLLDHVNEVTRRTPIET